MADGRSCHAFAQPKTEKQQESIKKRLLSREEKKRQKLAELGIDYDFDGYAKSGQQQEEQKDEVVGEAAPAKAAKGKKGRKSAGGDEVRWLFAKMSLLGV